MKSGVEIENNFLNYALVFSARKTYDNFIKAVADKNQISVTYCQKIYSLIDDIVFGQKKDQFIKNIPTGSVFYRARIVNPNDDCKKGILKMDDGMYCGFDEINSKEPIIGKGGAGRNNFKGCSYLYVASEPETACMEVKPKYSEMLSLAEFKAKKDMKVVDFASEKTFEPEMSIEHGISLGTFFTYLMYRYMEPVNNDEEYYVTQIISDYIRKTGIDGIAYGSFLTPTGTNYTFFNSHPKNIKFMSSKLLVCRQADYCFWDMNSNTEIHSNLNHERMNFDIRDMKDIKNDLDTWLNAEK